VNQQLADVINALGWLAAAIAALPPSIAICDTSIELLDRARIVHALNLQVVAC
jgi:hypothetical protein